jgi:hypothetical protein
VKRSGWTLIELLAVIFVITATMVTWQSVATTYGPWWGAGAAFCSGSLSIITVVLFYRWTWRRDERGLQMARDKYRDIYRIVALPAEPSVIVMPEGAEIRVGDFGWTAGPSRDDGLIYLQGLTLDWTVVWHAGLPPDGIEKCGTKPHSQYDSWHPFWADPPPLPPCPFPVIERETMTVGRPHHNHSYLVQPTVYHPRCTVKDTEIMV